MFNHQAKIDYSLDEATVTEIDTVNRLCRVKTLTGRNLNGLQWVGGPGGSSRGGDREMPRIGDRAIIHSGLGYPIIWGFLPRLQGQDNTFPIPIDTGEQLVDTGSFSSSGNSVTYDQNASSDITAGDRVIASQGGGLLAVLRGGSLLLRSSRLSEIFLSKWDDLVRVVSRNWEHFTDLSSDTIKNLGGRVYRFTGYAKTFKDAKVENYLYNQYIGDVAIAETGKATYLSAGSPSVDDRIYKEEIVTASGSGGHQLMKREIHLDGSHDLIIKSADGTTFTRIHNTNGEVTITYKDVNVIKINATQLNATFGGDPTINLNASGVQATFGSGQINMSSSGVNTTFSGHFVNVTSSGVSLG